VLASKLTTHESVFFITGRSFFGMDESKRSLGSTFSTSYFYSTCEAYLGRSSTIRKEKISRFWERRDPKEQKDVRRVVREKMQFTTRWRATKCSHLIHFSKNVMKRVKAVLEKHHVKFKSSISWSKFRLVDQVFRLPRSAAPLKSLFFNHRHGSKIRNRLGGINLEQITVRRDW